MGCAVHVAGLPGSELSAGLSPNVSYHAVDFPLLRTGRLMGLMIRHDIDVAHAHLGPACKALAAVRAPVRKVATLHVGYKPHQHAGLDGYRGQSRVIANWIPTPRPSVRTELGLPPETLIIGTVGRLHAGLPVIATRTDGPMEYMPDQPITLVEPDSVTALAGALQLYIQHPTRGPRYDLRDFDPSANIAQILDFYGQLTSRAESHDALRIAAAI